MSLDINCRKSSFKAPMQHYVAFHLGLHCWHFGIIWYLNGSNSNGREIIKFCYNI